VHAARVAGPGDRPSASIARTGESAVPDTAVDAAAETGAGAPAPGRAVAVPGGILVACAEGTALLLTELQLEGRRRLSAPDFLKGAPLPPGTLLGA
jgi:methionyl-tRNA formyltransferase